jgi:hypothetical protein
VLSLRSQPSPIRATHCVTIVARGLALLAKRATLVNGAKRGVELVSTDNDETNGPMLRVNEQLGYRPIGSTLTWSRP